MAYEVALAVDCATEQQPCGGPWIVAGPLLPSWGGPWTVAGRTVTSPEVALRVAYFLLSLWGYLWKLFRCLGPCKCLQWCCPIAVVAPRIEALHPTEVAPENCPAIPLWSAVVAPGNWPAIPLWGPLKIGQLSRCGGPWKVTSYHGVVAPEKWLERCCPPPPSYLKLAQHPA